MSNVDVALETVKTELRTATSALNRAEDTINALMNAEQGLPEEWVNLRVEIGEALEEPIRWANHWLEKLKAVQP